MTEQDFLSELAEVLQTDDILNLDTALENVPQWDSIASMSIAAMLDMTFGKRVSFADIQAMKTVRDIARAAGLDL